MNKWTKSTREEESSWRGSSGGTATGTNSTSIGGNSSSNKLSKDKERRRSEEVNEYEERYYLNVYRTSTFDDNSAFPVEYSEHTLHFKPTLITTAYLYQKNSQQVFLIGSDNSFMRLFCETSESSNFKFSFNDNISALFPEFNFQSPLHPAFHHFDQQNADVVSGMNNSTGAAVMMMLWVDVFYVPSDAQKRLAAVAWEDGTVQLSLCDLNGVGKSKPESDEVVVVVFNKLICFDGPVTQLRFFSSNTVDVNSPVNIVICTALEFIHVYHDVNNCIFGKPIVIEGELSSLETDCVLCCVTYDIDMDSDNEIIIGTFYQQIAAFKYSSSKNIYELLWDRKYPGPVRGLEVVDLSNDGVNDLIVVTNNSVHIMQHNITYIAQLCKQKLLKNLELLST